MSRNFMPTCPNCKKKIRGLDVIVDETNLYWVHRSNYASDDTVDADVERDHTENLDQNDERYKCPECGKAIEFDDVADFLNGQEEGRIPEPELKYFECAITTHDGESEYGDKVIIQAKDLDEAEKAGREIARAWYGEEGKPWGDSGDMFEEDGGYRLIEFEYAREIEPTFEALLSAMGGIWEAKKQLYKTA